MKLSSHRHTAAGLQGRGAGPRCLLAGGVRREASSVIRHPSFVTRRRAFSLLELLVAVGILSVIILALYAMFDQTQKALRANTAQTDVSESGRAALDLLIRDLERTQAAGLEGGTNNLIIRRTYPEAPADRLAELFDNAHRDSRLHEVFFLTRPQPHLALAGGLFVAEAENPRQPVTNFVGTLYRFEAPALDAVVLRGPRAVTNLHNAWVAFNTAAYRSNYSSRLLDGVVFFRVIAYGPNGLPIDGTTQALTNRLALNPPLSDEIVPFLADGTENVTTFGGRQMPTALEVEFGMLPPQLLEQFHVLPAQLRPDFLRRNLASLLVFRQRIGLRTALQ